jgi:hypothetical protein
MATKKTTIDDFTEAPQARTAEDVNNQDARTRLWQSLDYTYGQQRKQSDKQFAQAYSQADRQALSRGMGRSSYNNQVLANIRNQGIEANNNIYAAQIADYQNRIGQIEQQEKEDERWERQFAAGREDAAWNKEFQQNQFDYGKERDLVADAQWQKQYDEQLRQFNENMAFQRERANVSDAQWEKEYAEKLRQFNEQMAENKRQFDLNYNEDVRRYELSRADAATSGGGGGRGGNGGNDGNGDGDETDTGNPYDQFLNDLFGGTTYGNDMLRGFVNGNSNVANNGRIQTSSRQANVPISSEFRNLDRSLRSVGIRDNSR